MLGQGPEIATHYEQRLGETVNELAGVIGKFDADAGENGLSRAEALAAYRGDSDDFLRGRAQSMQAALARFDELSRQAADFSEASELFKPIQMVRNADKAVLEEAKTRYSPELPATAAGSIYGGAGAVLGLLFGGFLSLVAGSGPPRHGSAHKKRKHRTK